jgi:hypothetical protein
MCLRVSGEQIWMARVHLPRSTTEVSFRIPLSILPLVVVGGLESNVQLGNGQDQFALINDIQANSRSPLPFCL